MLENTILTVGDARFIYKKFETQSKDRLATKNLYGAIFYEHCHLSIKSETDYYSTRFQLHVVKIMNPAMDVKTLIEETFQTNDLNTSEPHKVPVDRQLSLPLSYKGTRINILTDGKCSLQSSDNFKTNARIIKTFYKTFDIWNFNYYFHYGSGILLNNIFEEGISNSHPIGCFFVLQADGDPRASITLLLGQKMVKPLMGLVLDDSTIHFKKH